MRYVLERVTGPNLEPMELARMKRELDEFASITEFDDDIEAKFVAAREWVEDFTGRALVDQVWRLTVDQRLDAPVPDVPRGPGWYAGSMAWASQVGEIYLRKSPAIAITRFVTVDSAGAETEIDPSTYELREGDSKWPRLVPLNGATWMGAELLRLTFRAGFVDRVGSPIQDATVIPERFKQAMILWVKANYKCDPADMPALVKAAENLIKPEVAHLRFA